MARLSSGPNAGANGAGTVLVICAVLAVVAAVGWVGGGAGGPAKLGNWWGGGAVSPVAGAGRGAGEGAGGDLSAPGLPQGFGPSQGRAFAAGLATAPVSGPFGTGWQVTGQSDAAVLATYRLRPGDVVLDLDGQPLTQTRFAGLADEMGRLDAAEITFMRGGRVRKRLLTFDR